MTARVPPAPGGDGGGARLPGAAPDPGGAARVPGEAPPAAEEPLDRRAHPPLARSFYGVDAVTLAPLLLNKVVVRTGPGEQRAGRIVEVEAYAGSEDPASHAYRGPTARNATMFGPGGHLYVYLSYGMHHCANVVCGPEGVSQAVLLRALRPVSGIDAMRRARAAARSDRDLARGPGRLCQAMGIHRMHDGADLVTGSAGIVLVDDGAGCPEEVASGPRIGVGAARERPWRWWVDGDPWVSGHRDRRGGPGPGSR